MDIEVEVVGAATAELLTALNRLLPQLSTSAAPLDIHELRSFVASAASTLLVARAGTEIVGTLTLVMFRIPTGKRAWIEDVVVDEPARGHGVAAALTVEAVRLARAAGARTIDLTSRPSREAANRLYERLGFRLRDSKVYRLATETGEIVA